jgi:hypothetical protein
MAYNWTYTVLKIMIIMALALLIMGCSKTVYTTQSGQTWTEYKSAKNNNGKIVNKTKKPKTKKKKKQKW